jgi:serine/threonine-protein kinase RsbW
MNRRKRSANAGRNNARPNSGSHVSLPMADACWNTLINTSIPSDPLAGRQVMEELLKRLEQFQWPSEEVFGVHLAVEEALVNAMRHGNQEDVNKQVSVLCKISNECLRIEIADEGPGFNPADVPDPTEDENIPVPSGRGIMLMRNFMTSVEYNEIGNRVVMQKRRTLGS